MLKFLFETFLLGIQNLGLHKLRSLLTALGIIFGVAAVIIVVAIGEGAKQSAMDQLKQLGEQNILVRSVLPPESNQASGRTNVMLEYGLKDIDLERLTTMLPGIQTIVPLRDTEQKVVRHDIRANANAIGTTPDVFDVIHLRVEPPGRPFTSLDYDRSSGVCVIGASVSKQLFPFEDPLGQTILVGSGPTIALLTVVGVLEPTGLRAGSEGAAMVQRDLDQDVYFPLTLARRIFGSTIVKEKSGGEELKRIELTEIWLQARDANQVEQLASIVENIVKIDRAKPDVEVKAPIEILRNAQRLNRVFDFVIGGIASFSLIVGGIGIMNIMLATVTERTREVGIRRALGAKRRHITMQFLLETTLISLSGGLIGIGVGIAGAALLPKLVHLFSADVYPTQIAVWSILVSFIASGAIGIGFGIYPAILAARMNPIDALRHE
ncbi:MAG: ABC transporter permease [Planctomycetota bacterium]|nr:ABC transporter permease [Planctomycetota bacterium]